jgi:hypothetical protein
MFNTQSYQYEYLLDTIVAAAVQPNNYELLHHLGQVLGLRSDHTVLMIADQLEAAHQVLIDQMGCQIEVFKGDPQHLLYEDATFDSLIVVQPVTQPLHPVARELARVLKPNGMLGMIIVNVHPDQIFGKAAFEHTKPLTAISRPAAIYRAVLAESGFTAFVSENRRRSLHQTALESYRQHILQSSADVPAQAEDVVSQALSLMISGSIGVTLVTAEKAI